MADRQQIRAFHCANRHQRWTRDAQEVIREAPEILDVHPDGVEILVAVDREGKVVGVIVFGTDPTIRRPVVFSLGVVPDRRREGIGFGLKLAALTEFATAAQGPVVVVSEVHRRNHAMLELNVKLGAVMKERPEVRKMIFVSVGAELQGEE